MALDFPDSPSTGDTFTVGSKTFEFDGVAWTLQTSAGAAGANGADGNTVLNGSGAPASSVGVDGDFYIDTDVWDIYGPKASGAWPLGETIVGTTGSTGPQGPTGAQGPAGADGSDGGVGPQGPIGETGVQGPAGEDGNTLLSGTVAPVNALGVDGDHYFDTVATTWYGPKDVGAWPAGVELLNTGTTQTLENKSFQGAREEWSVFATGATGTLNVSVKDGSAVLYAVDASADWTINIRGDASTSLESTLAVGQSVTVAFAAKQGTTAYYPSAIQVDGNAQTPLWAGGSAPTGGNASSTDLYLLTVIKVDATPTYTVLGQQVQFA